MNKKVFRGDIEGLRAYAVLFVLLFHADLAFSGGFVGVDIFFVISGFLITGNLLKRDIHLLDFYKKRIIRLYPALCITVLLTLTAAFLLLDPQLFVETAKSAIYTIFSASNFYFAYDGGYFATASNLKPLLHTWSLGVEQQFYLIWPLAILLVKKASPRFCLLILTLITLTSLLLSQIWISINSDTAYFLLPFRLFELSIGGVIAATRFNFKGWISEFSFVVGMVTILYCAFSYSPNVPFPGIYAFLPCIGAVLCIMSGQSRLSFALMGNAIARFIGKISYSVYLVHWPIIVLYSYTIFSVPSTAERFGMVVLSIAIAIPVYYFCEHKCQLINDTGLKTFKPLIFSALSLVSVSAASLLIINQNGMIWRLSDGAQTLVKDGDKFHRMNWGGAGYNYDQVFGRGESPMLISGDSFALHLYEGLDNEITKYKFIGHSHSGCFFGENISRYENGKPEKACILTYEKLKRAAIGNDYPLILAFSWDSYKNSISKNNEKITFKSDEEYYKFLTSNIESIAKAIGPRRIYIIGSPPLNKNKDKKSIVSCLTRPTLSSEACKSFMQFDESDSSSIMVNKAISTLQNKNRNLVFIDPSKYLCENGRCDEIKMNNVMYSDGVHYSKFGSRFFISKTKDLF